MYLHNKPASLEEAFDIVRGQVPQKMKSVLNDPFGSFVANLAEAIKTSKQTYVPKKEPEYVEPETFHQEFIEEEFTEQEEIYLQEALSELEIALQKAREEVQQRQEFLAEQEAQEELAKQLLAAEEKARLAQSLTNLEEAFQKAKNEICGHQQTNEGEAFVVSEKQETEEEDLDSQETEQEESETKKPYIPVNKQQESNPYLKELVRSSGAEENKPKGSRRKFELKKMIAEQISAELNSFKQQLYSSNLMLGGGGGGTNAVQYAAGGTMNGDLNVNGTILSAGLTLNEVIQQSIFTTVASISSQFGTKLPEPLVIDDGNY